MNLAAYLGAVYLPPRIEVSAQYAAFLYRVVKHFSIWLGRPAELSDLTERAVCGYLAAYRKRWGPRATNNQRQVLLSIWQDAADNPRYAGLLFEQPNARRIRKLPEEADPPQAWPFDQVLSGLKTMSCQNEEVIETCEQ